jgi:uncharacterized protein (TIGR02117 family)
MKKYFPKIKLLFFRIIFILVLIPCLYLTCAFTLPVVRVNTQQELKTDSVSIFVLSNGVHTDIALPSHTTLKNWESTFCKDTFKAGDPNYTYIAFGWGDKGFYLNTPEWSDLKVSTALKAAFGIGGTAMHVRYLKAPAKLSDKIVKLNVSSEQYKKLIEFIEQSFCEANDCVIKIDHPGYGHHDLFYEAEGKYSLVKTCNVWTNKALKFCGVRTGFWTPFADGLMRSIQ